MASSNLTYDFGVAIAGSTINKFNSVAKAAAGLAASYYALEKVAGEYIQTLKENAVRFGGYAKTMREMENARDKILDGNTLQSVNEQMSNMNKLMSVGVKDVRGNMEFIEKAAHATGQDISSFTSMYVSAVNGNLQGLVDAGYMTQRATRMFDKFKGNQIMMREQITKFLQSHKGLQEAMKNDFMTISDYGKKIKMTFDEVVKMIVGQPNDPESLYYSVVKLFKSVSDGFNMVAKKFKPVFRGISIFCGYLTNQVAKAIDWVAKKVEGLLSMLNTEKFISGVRGLIVWLEFVKQKIIGSIGSVSDRLKSFVSYLGEEFGPQIKMIKNGWSDIIALFSGFTQSNGFKRMVQDLKDLGAIVKFVVGGFTQLVKTLGSFGNYTIRKSLLFMQRMFGGLSKKSYDAEVASLDKEIYDSFFEIGKRSGDIWKEFREKWDESVEFKKNHPSMETYRPFSTKEAFSGDDVTINDAYAFAKKNNKLDEFFLRYASEIFKRGIEDNRMMDVLKNKGQLIIPVYKSGTNAINIYLNPEDIRDKSTEELAKILQEKTAEIDRRGGR